MSLSKSDGSGRDEYAGEDLQFRQYVVAPPLLRDLVEGKIFMTQYIMKCGHVADDRTEIGEPVCTRCVGRTPLAFEIDHIEEGDIHYWYFTYDVRVPRTGYARKTIGCVSGTSPTFPLEQAMAAIDNIFDAECDIIISDIQLISQSDCLYLLKRLNKSKYV